ncbi:hypothetical protein [Yeosuana sp. AK3]
MKYFVFIALFMVVYTPLSAQEKIDVNGKTYELKTEVEGELDLLWHVIDKQYRYFVKTNEGNILELLNTKKENRFQEEYKAQLNNLTQNNSISTSHLNFTLQDLKLFVRNYNKLFGSTYNETYETLKWRLGFFGGITNQPFVTNPNNTTVPFFGAELEGLSSSENSRHAGFFSILHALDDDAFEYSSTQLALGYRYRFIKKSSFNVYGSLRLATYTFSKQTFKFNGLPNKTINESNFQIPGSFGLGADIKVGKNSFLTMAYNELFAVFINNAGNFPVDFAIGYKFGL